MTNRITCGSFDVSWVREGTGAGLDTDDARFALWEISGRLFRVKLSGGRRPQRAARARRPIISFQVRRSPLSLSGPLTGADWHGPRRLRLEGDRRSTWNVGEPMLPARSCRL